MKKIRFKIKSSEEILEEIANTNNDLWPSIWVALVQPQTLILILIGLAALLALCWPIIKVFWAFLQNG